MEKYKLYHATERKKALNIIKTKRFDIPKDTENKEFLGEGAYYYDSRTNAIEWNSKSVKDTCKANFPSYKDMLDKYSIITSNIQIEENEILDLDNRSDIIKYKIAVKIVKERLQDIDNYNDRNELGTIINYLYQNKKMKRKMIVKTIMYPIPNSYGVKLNKRVYCIKDKSIILDFSMDKNIDWEEYRELEKLYS